MKTLMKAVITAGIILPLVFEACRPHDLVPPPVYHITKSVYYDDNGVATDSAKFTYNGNTLTRVDVSGDKSYYTTFEYTSGQITKKNVFYTAASTTADEYTNITYSGNTITLMEHYSKSGSNYIKDEVYTFSYNGTQVSKIIVSDNKTGQLNPSAQFDYTYNNNNIVSVKSTDLTDNSSETFTYTYDKNNNYYTKLFSQSLITDPMNEEIDETTMPFIVSTNNIISLTIMGQTVPVAYTLDNNNNLSKITLNTKQAVTYQFSQY